MMRDRRSAAVAGRIEQSRTRLQVGLGLFLSILLVQGVVSMTLPGKQATEVANVQDRFAVAELSDR
jgi:hypothetical protein